jgi:iron complex outermembrane recepter protein
MAELPAPGISELRVHVGKEDGTVRILLFSITAILVAAPLPAAAQSALPGAVPAAVPVAALEPPDTLEATGRIIGTIRDAGTGEPVAAAQVRLREMRRSELSHRDGRFHFFEVRPGRYTLSVERIGYAPAERRVDVAPEQTVEVTIELRATALEIPGVVVTGTGRERGAGDVYQPTSVIGDAELRRRLATSLAATIAHEPGIHQQYNGPAASQPVIRGMGGDRVVVLEDGHRTGDLYSTGADHAVTVDPLTVERIEVLRGPAALLYGSSALGGVINVIREDVPRTLPERLGGTASIQLESVNRGATAGLAAAVPLGRIALRAEASGRQAGDTRTPLGVLESTQIQGHNLGVGASLIASWGYVGAAAREHRMDYGVPGEFGGVLIPGAHPGGVDIETTRRSARLEGGHYTGLGVFDSFELSASLTHYLHDEIEGRGPDGAPHLGARFDQLSGGLEMSLRHQHRDDFPFLRGGALGLEVRGKDLRTRGSSPGTRSATESGIAFYLYEELGFEPVRVKAGVRYDHARVEPRHDDPILVGDRAIPVRARTFGSFSGSVAALLDVAPGWTAGVSVARAFRRPAIEELFSDGPHLADFSYDIGNPELDPEFGLGVDAFVRASLPRLHLEASAFANRMTNFIHYQATGELDPRFRRYPVFEARGDDAVFVGVETRAQWEVAEGLVFDGSLAGVRATRTESGDPLPDIPPVSWSTRVRYDAARWFGSLGWDGMAAQNRVPAVFPSPADGEIIHPQRPTPGSGLLNAGLGWRWSEGERFHTVTLKVNNLLDTEWRDHLSRIKEVAPQPGRNIQLLYRLNF